MPRTPNLLGDIGLSSTFTLAIVISPSYSEANSSKAGAICLQGPHHSAQKSTTTGIFEPITSSSKVASVTCVIP